MSESTPGVIGQSVRRREDGRLLVGHGRYVADLPLESALHVAIVRSPHAHARIVGIDARAAGTLPGVRAVMTLADRSDDLLGERHADTLHDAALSLTGHDEGVDQRRRRRARSPGEAMTSREES